MNPQYIHTIVQLALAEDIGQGDITTENLIPKDSQSRARIVCKTAGVICGIQLAAQVFKTLSPSIKFRAIVKDGQKVRPGQSIAEITGPTRALLSGERVALNFLSYLSSVATQTRQYVDAVIPHKTAILDTRKTTPLLRQLDRYAVKTGGGENHRFNLNDMALIKDNHLAASTSGIRAIINDLKKKVRTKIEVEVDNLKQFKEALASRADIILLDNMTSSEIARAVKIREECKSHVLLEASGGITLKNVKKYAATGVDRISIGALTHTRNGFDVSIDFLGS